MKTLLFSNLHHTVEAAESVQASVAGALHFAASWTPRKYGATQAYLALSRREK